eukprot:CAMPEP_0182464466 /NCGR_PEP_ID=MMETSP1319-20130603/8660_1 /TAXON_ID=172717 /ORGANISM="Bolidomonas pacifica, Strain RCC208" /LENGTH=512 /DNA_ID=CAMNT_0024664109 /DNA_START=147 /DNA_END=1685 /DNA_ORIENTATION=-
MFSPPPPKPSDPVSAAAEVPLPDPEDPMGIVKYCRALTIAQGGPDPLANPPSTYLLTPPPSSTNKRKPAAILPPPPPPPCARVGCYSLGSLDKRCSKCLVASYCCVECQREHWPAHKKQCKVNRRFELSKQTEEYLFGLRVNFGAYFDRIFAGNEEGFERYSALFGQLGNIGFELGRGINGITVGVLMILRSYRDRGKLEALAKLTGPDEGFDDRALHLEAMRSLVPLLEEAYAAGDGVTEEEVLDGVMALGEAYMWMEEWDECKACYKRAEEGFVRLLGEDSAKAVNAAYSVAGQIVSTELDRIDTHSYIVTLNAYGDEKIAEYRRLWAKAKVSLPEEAVTYGIGSDLGVKLHEKGKHEEAKVFKLAALEGRRRVLGNEHKDTLSSMTNMGNLLDDTGDHEGALDYYQQAVRVQEKLLGKTHPSTLNTIYNTGLTYQNGLKDFVKAEEMNRKALDGYERSLGKEHEDTKRCAHNLACLFQASEMNLKPKMATLVKEYPHLTSNWWVQTMLW